MTREDEEGEGQGDDLPTGTEEQEEEVQRNLDEICKKRIQEKQEARQARIEARSEDLEGQESKEEEVTEKKKYDELSLSDLIEAQAIKACDVCLHISYVKAHSPLQTEYHHGYPREG